MKILLLALLSLFPTGMLLAQSIRGDSVLAAERSIDRPITLHARQFRITGSYGLSVISRQFDNNSKTVELKEEGLSSVRHRFTLDLRYGVHEFVQVTVGLAQSSNIVREPSMFIFPMEPDPVISHDVVRQYSGLDDLYLGLDLRAPLKTRKVDVGVTLGISVPVVSNEPAQPKHSLQITQENGSTVNKFVYRYYNPPGKGVPVATLGGILKYRTTRWAVAARAEYQHGLKDGKSFQWKHQLTEESDFEYRKDPISFQLADSYNYFIEFEFQSTPWLDLFLNVSGYNSFRGWSSSEPGLKVSLPFESSVVMSPGFEIIITPRLWLRERISFSAAGKNYEAPLTFQTSLMYNFFPFK